MSCIFIATRFRCRSGRGGGWSGPAPVPSREAAARVPAERPQQREAGPGPRSFTGSRGPWACGAPPAAGGGAGPPIFMLSPAGSGAVSVGRKRPAPPSSCPGAGDEDEPKRHPGASLCWRVGEAPGTAPALSRSPPRAAGLAPLLAGLGARAAAAWSGCLGTSRWGREGLPRSSVPEGPRGAERGPRSASRPVP